MFRIQGIGIALSIMLTGFSSNAEAGKVLPIPPKLQSTPSWCWLATGEMVFKYYKIAQNHPTDFQCGEARFQGAVQVGIGGPMSFWGPCWVNCNNCRSASAGSVQGLINMINQYPPAMKIINGSGVVLQAPQVSLTALDLTIYNLKSKMTDRSLLVYRPAQRQCRQGLLNMQFLLWDTIIRVKFSL
jgi:hypothetical protein